MPSEGTIHEAMASEGFERRGAERTLALFGGGEPPGQDAAAPLAPQE